jgi:hypothetical protein
MQLAGPFDFHADYTMRKIILTLILLAIPSVAFCQGGTISSQTFSPTGQPRGGVTVTVCVQSASVVNGVCTPAESDANCCFTDSTLGTHLTPPPSGGTLLSSGLGNYTFWAAPGLYHVSYSGPGVFSSDQLVPVPAVPPTLFIGAPTGSCITIQQAIDTATGNFYGCIAGAWIKIGPGSGGSVTSVSDGGLAPLFTTSVATPTTTPAITNTAITQNANTFYTGPSGTATDLVDFSVATATGAASPISISATPQQSGDLAIVFSVRDNLGGSPYFTPDVSWTASSTNNLSQEFFYKNISGLATATASGAIGSHPNWAAALALFTAKAGFTPAVTNQAGIVGGAWSSFSNQAIGFTPTAGRTLIVAIMSGYTSFNLGPVGVVSFTDSVGDVFSPISVVVNNAGQGEEIILLAATNIVGGATTFSNILSSSTCPGCGIANGIAVVFEVSNLAPVNSLVATPTFRYITGADLPRPSPVSVGAVFSKATASNQFLTAVNTDGTIAQAQPSFANLSGTIAAAQVPATTSNCTGNGFAQGLNAGFTPICATVTAAGVQVFSATTLGSDVSVSATTQTDVMTRTITMPSSGCPCRVLMSYSLYITTASSGVGYSAWVNDGSVNMGGSNAGQSNGSSGGLTNLSYSGYTTATYTNNTAVTFTLRTEGSLAYTVRAASQVAGSAPNSSFQVAASTSN